MADADRAAACIDLVTVVFAAEIPLLILQARSIARYLDGDSLGELLVILNDPDEAGCRRGVERMRHEYGRFAERLRVVAPAELIEPPTGRIARMRSAWVAGGRTRLKARFGRRRRGGNPGGWHGNSGWAMQQAFKLLSGSVCSSGHVVFLDAKNHFLRAVDASTFVAADGRARSRAVRPDEKQRAWVDASFAALGLPPPPQVDVPPTVTPFAIERKTLVDCAAGLAEALGPLECFFAMRRGQATEFMLLYAALDRGQGDWWRRFADGLPESLTVYRPTGKGESTDTAMLDAIADLRRHPSLVAGFHRTRLTGLDGDARQALLGLWVEHGLVADLAELDRLFPPPDRFADAST